MSVKKTNILPGEKMLRCALACVAGGLRRVATPLPFVAFSLFLSLSAKIQYGAHNLRGPPAAQASCARGVGFVRVWYHDKDKISFSGHVRRMPRELDMNY